MISIKKKKSNKKQKEWCIKFLVDYSNKSLRDIWKNPYSKYIRFDYYNVTEEELENVTDKFFPNYAVVYYLKLDHIYDKNTNYFCFIDESSNVNDIDGLLNKISNNDFVDLIRYNTLTCFKASKIKKVII